MAVMTTQHSDGLLLDEKPLKMSSAVETDARNGSLKVNGHTSPGDHQPEEAESKPNGKDEEPTPQAVKVYQSKNQEAFASNKALKMEAKENGLSSDPSHKELEQDAKAGTDQGSPATDEPKDTELADAPAPARSESPASKEEDASEKQADKTETPQRPTSERDETPAKPAVDASSASALSSKDTEDVAMSDAPTQGEPSQAADPVESTQETNLSDASPVSPDDDLHVQPTSFESIAVDASQPSPTAPASADTSISDAPLSAVKVSRERDDDGEEDEPLAKRVRVEPTKDEVQVKTIPKNEDAMDLDEPSNSTTSSVYHANGQLKRLTDNSLNGNPITDWQSRQIRTVLAGVKKTKAGANFKLPVATLWPALWSDYSAKISEPTDISTMEKKLRGELPRYQNMGEFKSELNLLVQNSVIFNGDAHEVTRAARQARDTVLERMSTIYAAEPAKPEKKETVKQHPTRHAEPRPTPNPPGVAVPRRPSKGGGSSPPHKPAVESPAFAIPPNNNGMPLIRKEPSKNDSRAKRPVKPALSKDLVYEPKRKKKLAPELRFCEEVLTEIRKTKYYDVNSPFMQPVDPVALNIPSYHKVIKKPMDLQTMANKMSAGEYVNAKEFERDFDLIVKNCRTFNGEEHTIYATVLRLQNLFRKEYARKDEWMARHAPASATGLSHATTGLQLKDDSDEGEPESEGEPEPDEEQKASQARVQSLIKRLEEEEKKLKDMIMGGDISEVEIQQVIVQGLQNRIVEERAKLSAMTTAKKPTKPKPAKAKKPSGTGGGAGGGSKKAYMGTSSNAGAGAVGSKKSGAAKKVPPRRKMGALEKDVIANGIERLASLEGQQLERAIEIIKRDTGQGENDSGELELDIEVLSDDALNKLYDIVTKAFPTLRAEKEKTFVASTPPQPDPPSARSKAAQKAKKNKPMSKTEQERRIAQLNELRAQAGRQGSGSQEPMESIEGNGGGSADAAPAAYDSEDEESQSSEED
ncbi:Bromodomain-containing factor 1 [Diplogelasinospora grovesii]|uniref:Bromodomain-containing factor 1 n=1 Tax=Diplogelasinospora grovesii TaxID=303347 RepID=A0AAN6S140_9PEZI|nr:Bromodomain-containing factor 1 [Diplogelasinospora grovesii]